jgi:hypothetical protein
VPISGQFGGQSPPVFGGDGLAEIPVIRSFAAKTEAFVTPEGL